MAELSDVPVGSAEAAAASDISPTLVIGAGLLGASIGCALTAQGVDVRLSDRVRAHAVVAAGLQAGSTQPPDPQQVKLVVVAVPPASIPAVVKRSLERYPNATVTDVGSVKGVIVAALGKVDTHRYVGSHPMAGSAYSGPLRAVPELFYDRTWVITPGDADDLSLTRTRTLARLCGARLVEMSPADHDRAVAEVSHLPQLMSSLTATRLNEVPEEHLRLAGQGVRDVTRIAASDPRLWTQIISANADAVRTELEAVRDTLDELLEGWGDEEALRRFLADGRRGVRELPGKHGTGESAYAEVIVAIPDTPGALARLFADVEAAGVNVEDIRIDHDPEREVGYLAVGVTKAARAGLEEAMTEAGWTLRYSESL